MNNNFIKYFSLSLILALALIILANFIAIKIIDNRVLHFVNKELETPLARIKLRCEKELPQFNKVFFKYKKSFEQCKIYNTNLDFRKNANEFDYNKYLLIPKLSIKYQLLRKNYTVSFDTIVKTNTESDLDNYYLSFADPIIFHVKHDEKKVTDIKMQSYSSISLIHKLGMEIAQIKDHKTDASFEDNNQHLGFAIDLALKFSTFEDFLQLLRKHGKKTTINGESWNDIHFDFEVMFEKYTKEEQEELRKHNPQKYQKEKNFYKNLIYNIGSIKASHQDYSLELSGNVTKTPKPGMPDLDLLLKIDNIDKFLEDIKNALKAAFYNQGDMEIYNNIRPDVAINAFIKTLQELSILEDTNLVLSVKSDAIGTVSIGGTNFFSFQKKLFSNFVKLKGENIIEDFNKSDNSKLDSDSSDNFNSTKSDDSEFDNSESDN